MTRKANSISILRFGAGSISLLRARPSAKGIDLLSQEQETGSWSSEDGSLQEALARFVKKHGVAADAVYTVLPRHEMAARILSVPSQDPAEIESMVRLSAEEFVPYPVDELVVSFGLIQKLADGSARIMAVFAHRDLVESHVAILRDAGIEPEEIYVSTACLVSVAIAAQRTDDERMALVHLGSAGLEVLVLDGDQVRYSRGVSTLHDWTLGDDPALAEEVAAEVRASLSAYLRESDDGQPPEYVYLSCEPGVSGSDTVATTDLARAIEDAVGAPCSVAPFADALAPQRPTPAEPIPLVSLGAALAAQNRTPLSITLTPSSLAQARKRRRLRAEFTKVAALVLLLVATLGVYCAHEVYVRQAYLADLNARIAEVQPVAEVVAAQQERLRALQEHIGREGTVVELLARLSEVAPPEGLSIIEFVFNDDEGITIEGRAISNVEIDAFAGAIRELGRTEVPQFKRARSNWWRRSEYGQPYFRYKIEIPFAIQEEDAESPTNE